MIRGIDTFKKYFSGYEDQYVLIGGAACDILFSNSDANFRATRDLDMVLLVEALTPEFGNRFWDFIKEGGYRNKASSNGNPQFYRFDKPEKEEFPKMIELFGRTEFPLREMTEITPIHLDDTVSSLSAILLNDEYYEALVSGRTVVEGLSVLKPEYLILFKAKAYLDLKNRKANGERVDSSDINKHKNDVLRIVVEMVLDDLHGIKGMVRDDFNQFLQVITEEPFDMNVLKRYGVKSEEVRQRLEQLMKE